MLALRAEQGKNFWKHWKKKTPLISSTEISAVFCMNKHKTRNQLFQEKKGKPRPENDCPATRHGRLWEPYAIGKVLEHFPEESWEFRRPGCLKAPPVCASPDLVLFSLEADVMIGLEVKCPYSAPIPKRKEDVCSEYLFQCFSCLMISRANSWLLAFYDTEYDRAQVFEIFPDSDLWERELLPRVEDFLRTVAGNTDLDRPFGRKGKKEKSLEDVLRRKLLDKTREREDLSSHPENDAYQ